MKIAAMIAIACALSATLDAQVPDFTPATPLIGALLHNDAAEAKRLLEQGADPNQGRFAGLPPVFLAIQRENLEPVRLMAARGADLHVRDRSGSTALMRAAFNETGNSRLVEELLRLGADPADANQGGETALVWASRRGDTQRWRPSETRARPMRRSSRRRSQRPSLCFKRARRNSAGCPDAHPAIISHCRRWRSASPERAA
jgi:ankyrin repeat protein